MMADTLHRRLWACLLAAMLAAGPVLLVPHDAEAQRRSSGGYSRPSSSVRTPSFSRPSAPRTPSFSGGYGRPSTSTVRPSLPGFGSQSAGDRSFSQERSGNAFGAYRDRQELARRQREYAQQPRPAPQAPSYGGGYGGRFGGGFGGGFAGSQYAPPARQGWFNNRGYAPPPSGYFGGGQRSFGVWDGLLLWTLFNNLGRSGSSDWFHNHRDDPGVQQWRQEAERLSGENADVRRKLDELDRSLAKKEGQPKDPTYLPPDIPPEIAAAPAPERTPGIAANDNAGGGGSLVWPVLLAGVGGLGYLAWRRRSPPAANTRGGPVTPLQQAGNLLRHKLSGEAYTPDRFRVGMTLALDPTPFILAGGALKLPQPDAGSGGGQVSVSAIGEVTSGGAKLTRLYLPDERSLVQLHLDAAGVPDECRLFGVIDEVAPADPAEWGVWLDPAEGLIGWPEFQTKDGKTYARVWVPGDGRVPPRAITETIEGLNGSRTVQSQAMLYAAPTGLPDPAPPTEYIMVSAVQDGGRAWVEIRAGVDLNPATLQLA